MKGKALIYVFLDDVITGLKVSYKLFPETLLTGTPPASICSGKASRQPQADTQAGFSIEDIDKLQMHLDNALLDSTFGSRSLTYIGYFV